MKSHLTFPRLFENITKLVITDPVKNKVLLEYEGNGHLIVKGTVPDSVLKIVGLLYEIKNLDSIFHYFTEKKEKNNDLRAFRMPTLALDTNTILSNFYYRVIEKQNKNLNNPKIPFITVLSRATAYEFHYKISFKIQKENTEFKEFVNNNPDASIVFNGRLDWKKTLSLEGRKGLSGIVKYYKLAAEKYTLIVKSGFNPLYNVPMLNLYKNDEEIEVVPPRIDTVFDSIIISEIDAFRTLTNAKILFVTGDRDLARISETIGLDHFFVQFYKKGRSSRNFKNISKNKLSELISELLVHYDILRFEIQKGDEVEEYFVSFANLSIHENFESIAAINQVGSVKKEGPCILKLML